ncbi:MAG: hypothetical protein H7Y38_17240 [Armatimonadetes bacterium]|nr:hypothetical protein [Armatimonadota bacterium]
MSTIANPSGFLQDLERIQQEFPADPRPQASDTQALNALFGVFKNNPRFDAVMQEVEAERQRQRDEAAYEYDGIEARSDKVSA